MSVVRETRTISDCPHPILKTERSPNVDGYSKIALRKQEGVRAVSVNILETATKM